MSHLLAASSSGSPVFLIFVVVIALLEIVGWWTTFAKAGRPGWGILIPFYNTYLFCKVAGRPGWWLILFFIPLLNIVMAFIVMIDIAKAFGKGAGFGIGLVFLPFVFAPMLGFGDATYTAPAA